jgi:acetolactate synthase-1/2/3 large subunit
VLVLGGDVWADHAEDAARRLAHTLGLPVLASGAGRGIVGRGDPLLVTRARTRALSKADAVVVVGTPLDFRLRFGRIGGPGAQVVHLMDAPHRLATHVPLAASAAGDLTAVLDGVLAAALAGRTGVARAAAADWLAALQDDHRAGTASDVALLTADADPVHPARIYGELLPLLADDAVVIGDGGDFVSWAGRFVSPARPGTWLDTGPFGCLGNGLGHAIGARTVRPSAQVVVLLGDGAAGFSLMDVDTLVRHRLPVVMVVGNNGVWGLELQAQRPLFDDDTASRLRPETRYDEVVRALGGAGETVARPDGIGPALRRAFDSGVPYLVNVVCDAEAGYPRQTSGI